MLEKILISYLNKGKEALSEYTFKNLKTKLLEALHKAFTDFLQRLKSLGSAQTTLLGGLTYKG